MDKKNTQIEVLAWISGIFLQCWVFWPFLQGQTSGIGDTLTFLFPAFSYFANSLIDGVFPLWDPYTHAGHPFYPILGINRLTEPVTVLTILIGKNFTKNLLVLFNWNLFTISWTALIGVYLVIRRYTVNLFVRLYFIPVLLFSTILFSSFWHVAALFHFLWIPYVFLYLQKIVIDKKYAWNNFLLLGLFLGLQGQSYFAASLLVFLLFYLISLIAFQSTELISLFKADRNIFKMLASSSVALALMSPTLVLAFDLKKFVFPYRMQMADYMSLKGLEAAKNIGMTYETFMKTGAVSNFWNFLWLIYPNWWGHPSEVFLSFGVLTWALFLIGHFFSAGKEMKILITLLTLFGLLILGPIGGIHRILFAVFPPMRYMRHLMELSYFFAFFFLIIAAKGAESLSRINLKSFAFIGTFVGLLVVTLFLVPSKEAYLLQIFLLLGVPVLAYSYFRMNSSILSKSILSVTVIVSLIGTTQVHLESFQQVYKMVPALEKNGIPIEFKPITFPEKRTLSPYEDRIVNGDPVALPALATRKTSLFNFNSTNDLKYALNQEIRTAFVMHKGFFELLRSDLSEDKFKDYISIDRPLLNLIDSKGKISVDNFNANRLTLTVIADMNSSLYWSDGYDANWRATLNGKPVEISKVNLNFKSVPVLSGQNRIEFKYRPWPFLIALFLYYFITLIFLAYKIHEIIKSKLVEMSQAAIKPIMPVGENVF